MSSLNYTPFNLEDRWGRKLNFILVTVSSVLILGLAIFMWYLLAQRKERESSVVTPGKEQKGANAQFNNAKELERASSDSVQSSTSVPAASTATLDVDPTTAPNTSPSGIMNP